MNIKKLKIILFHLCMFLFGSTIVCALTDNAIILFVSGVIFGLICNISANHFIKKEPHGNRSK